MLAAFDATTGDARLCWEWRNEPEARAASFDTDPIPYTDHEAWFFAHANSPLCRMYVMRKDDTPVAWVRFNWARGATVATISVVVAPEWRGCGIGAEAIEVGCSALAADTGLGGVDAFVKRGNAPSVRAFNRAGFHVAGSIGDVVIMRNYGDGGI